MFVCQYLGQLNAMADVCWSCSDRIVDDRIDTTIIYTSPPGSNHSWLNLPTMSSEALWPIEPPTGQVAGVTTCVVSGCSATFEFQGVYPCP